MKNDSGIHTLSDSTHVANLNAQLYALQPQGDRRMRAEFPIEDMSSGELLLGEGEPYFANFSEEVRIREQDYQNVARELGSLIGQV